MTSFLINVIGLVTFWHLGDLRAEGVLESVIYPLLFMLFLLSSLVWIMFRLPKDARGGLFGGDSGGYGGGDGGGDGGC